MSPLSGKMLKHFIILLLSISWITAEAAPPDVLELKFTKEPPNKVAFANTTGTVIECNAGGTPKPKITWHLVDGSIATNIPELREETSEGYLVFRPFGAERYRPDVHAAIYRCAATSTAGTIQTVDIQVHGVIVQKYDAQVYDVYAIQHNTAVMKCHVPSVIGDYVKVIAWIKNDKLLIKPSTEGDMNDKYAIMDSGDLHIRNTTMDESGSKYKCKTEHSLTGEIRISSVSGQLFVTESQGNVQPRIVDSLPTIKVTAGSKAVLPCVGQGHPTPLMKWMQKGSNGQMVSLPIGKHFIQTKSTLIIQDAQPNDAGVYLCEASNEMGTAVHEVTLAVTEPLSVNIVPVIQQSKVGESINFRCDVKGEATDSVVWFHNGRVIPNTNGNLLTIAKVQGSDQGMYQCKTKNDKYAVQATAELKLSEIAPYFNEVFEELIQKPGSSATVSCVASGIPLPTMSWLLDETPVKTSSRINITSTSDIQGRIVSHLTINRMVTEDGGVYSCVATNSGSAERHSSRINVFGTLAARKPITKSVVAGSNVYLNCPIYGYPINEISWSKDNSKINSFDRDYTLFANGTLWIKSAHRQSDNGPFQCQATNSLKQQVQSVVDVQVTVPPKIVPFAFQDELLREGMRARLQCVVSEGDLPLNVTWRKNGRPIPPELGILVRALDEFSSILTINHIAPHHNGKYTCVASNAAATVSHTEELSVNVPPRWRIQPQHQSVLKGTKVILDCQVDGYPAPTIKWIYSQHYSNLDNEQNVVYISHNVHIADNGSLIIQTVNLENEGYYLCRASNGIGRPKEAAVQVKINAPPHFKTPLVNVKVPLNKNVQWQCVVEGDQPVEVQWYVGNKRVQAMSPRITIQTINQTTETVSTLTIHKISRENKGNYKCVAKNSYGTNSSGSDLTILEPPDAPTNLKIASQTSSSIELDWEVSFDGNEAVKKFIIQYKEETDSWDNAISMETVNGVPTNSIVGHLRPASNYAFRVYAENAQGRSSPSQTLQATTNEDVPSGTAQDIQIMSLNTETFKVVWKAPKKNLWNGKILGYYVGYMEAESNGQYLFKTLLTPEPNAQDFSVEISGLKKFTKYAVIVQAYNSVGKGPQSEPIIVMTSEGAPSLPPTDLRCTTLTSQSIHVTWTAAPTESINGILQGYKIIYKPASDWFEDFAEMSNVSISTSFTLSQLEEFTNYSLEVLAMTKAGEGPRAPAIYCKTLDDVPDAPISVKSLTTSPDSVIVSWKAPEHPNGVIKSYSVYWRSLGSNQSPSVQSVPSSHKNYEVSRLKAGEQYEFWVTASTMAGEGAPSQKLKTSPLGPKVPAKVISFDDKVITAWKSDVNLPCLAVGIPDYQRNWMFKGETIESGIKFHLGPDGVLSIKSIQEEDAGDYICNVKNDFGEDKITYTVTVLAPPTAPLVETASTTMNSIDIRWKVASTKNSRIKGYTLQLKKDVGEWQEINLGADINRYKFDNLECGTRYEILVSAYNKIGIGAPSEPLIVSTNGSVPSPPSKKDLIEEATNSVSLYLNTWRSNGCPVQYYIVEYSPKSTNEWSLVSSSVKPEQRRLVIPGLKSGTWYGLRMAAHNSAGSSVAEYNFATLTNTGASIPPIEFQADAAAEEIDGLLAYLNFYLIVPVICTVIVLLAILGAACFYVKTRRSVRRNDVGNRVSTTSAELKLGARSGSFSYMQRGTLSRAADHSKLADDDLTPYATFQLSNQVFDTLGRRGNATPPVLPPRFEGFPSCDVTMNNGPFTPSGSGFIPGHGPVETTFIFPNVQSDDGMHGMPNYPPPPLMLQGYPSEELKRQFD